jgi:choline kinase
LPDSLTGVVLAAGPGRRLQPLTAALPKTLLQLSPHRTILDLVLSNLRSVGVADVLVVAGFAADRIRDRIGELERRYGLRLELVLNDRANDWNNAYSLWLARGAFSEGALLVNGDTVHPVTVEEALLAARGPDVLLAVDRKKPVREEAMKIVAEDGSVRRIGKELDAETAEGEYIGVALIESSAAGPLAEALEVTWRRDPSLYYEDGFQELVERGGNVGAASIGTIDWVEVDDHADLERARAIELGS